MSFRLDPSGIPTLRSYSEALLYWSNAHQWRNKTGEHDPRALAKSYARKRHVNIRKTGDGSITCRFYQTDVVTYHRDNSITIESFPSISTNSFANVLLPSPLRIMCNHSPSVIWTQDSAVGYKIGESFTIRKTDEGWQPVRPSDPIYLYQLDRKRASLALRARGYHDFKMMVRAGLVLRHTPAQDRCGIASIYQLRRDVFDKEVDYPGLLADQSRWFSVIEHCHSLEVADWFLAEMREAIYKADACVSLTELAYFTNYKQFQMVTQGMKYRNAELFTENRL